MVKVVLENREVMNGIEDRMSTAIQEAVGADKKLRSKEKKVLMTRLTQISASLIQKVKRNTRLADDDWSDADADEPPSKVAKTARLEPEDTVLKAKVETLRAKVKESAANVKSLRATAPSQIEEKLRASLQTAAEGLPTGAAQVEAPAEEAKEPRVSAAEREAFMEDSVSIAKRVVSLQAKLPKQIALGRTSIKSSQGLAALQTSKAEKMLVTAGGSSKENAGQQQHSVSRRAAVSRVFSSNQFR